MGKSDFHIISAVIHAWRFVWAERRYLTTLAIMPFAMSTATMIFVQFVRPDSSVGEAFLWGLPATILSAWFMFAIARLMILGERLPVKDNAQRRRQLEISAMVWTLFNMAIMFVVIFMEWAVATHSLGNNTVATGMGMVMLGLLFWGLRLGVAHIVAAVGYPIRKYLFRVNGIGISARLIAMGFLAALPVMFLLQIVLGLLPENADAAVFVVFSLVTNALSVMLTAALTASAVFALKEILGRGEVKA